MYIKQPINVYYGMLILMVCYTSIDHPSTIPTAQSELPLPINIDNDFL